MEITSSQFCFRKASLTTTQCGRDGAVRGEAEEPQEELMSSVDGHGGKG